MKRVECRGGGDPVIKDFIENGNGEQKTAIIIGDYTPDEKSWPNYQTFETWIKEQLSPDCHVVVPETKPEDARSWIGESQVLTIEGGFPHRYLEGIKQKELFDFIRDQFLRGGITEIGGLSAGAMVLCQGVRYYVEDDGDPVHRLKIRGGNRHTPKTRYRLEVVPALGLIPRTEIVPHFDRDKDQRPRFFTGPNAFVCLDDDGSMEVFYERNGGDSYRPVDVQFRGGYKIKFKNRNIGTKQYLGLLRSSRN